MTKDMRVSFLFILVFSLFEAVAGVKKNPNILLILADDVGQGDLPPYFNSSAVTMPNIENLVSKGLTFTDMHSTPLCAPSRYVVSLKYSLLLVVMFFGSNIKWRILNSSFRETISIADVR